MGQVRKATFGQRRQLVGFFTYFSACSTSSEELAKLPVQEGVPRLLEEFGIEGDEYAVGKTRVFMSEKALAICFETRKKITEQALEQLKFLKSVFLLRRA